VNASTVSSPRIARFVLCLALLAGCGQTAAETAGAGEEPSSGEGGAVATPGRGGAGGRPGQGGHEAREPDASLPADSAAPADPDAAPAQSDAARSPDAADAAAAPDATPPADAAAPDAAPPADARGRDGGPLPAYDPCPPKGKPCVALPLGDSLTQGAGSSGGGYRRELFRDVVAHGQSITFVGSQSSGPTMLPGMTVPFPRRHEGHGGFTIEGISTWITDNATIATYKPDIVMLQIGTNNGLRHPGANVPAALTALGALMDKILASDSHLLLIVAQITPSSADGLLPQFEQYNQGIPALVKARAAAGKHVAVVDIYKYFTADPNWRTDYLPTSDVHPIDAGYDAMGRGWSSALAPLLR
jgi:lysophospholipase L1-like esterase